MPDNPEDSVELTIAGVYPDVNTAHMNLDIVNNSSQYTMDVYGEVTAEGQKFGEFGVNLQPGEDVNIGREAQFDLNEDTDITFCAEVTNVEATRTN